MFDTKKSPTTRGRAAVAAKSNTKEREYWLQKLSGPIPRCFFPYDYKNSSTSFILDEAFFQFSQKAYSLLMGIKNHSDYTLHIYLTACSAVLLQNYCHSSNISLGTPIYKQEQEGDFINTILPLIFQLEPKMTVKDLLFQVRQTIMEAIEHQNYPVEIMRTELGLTELEDDFPLFSAAVCLENIHYRKYLQHLQIPIQFSFQRTATGMEVSIEYDSSRYERMTVERIFYHYQHLLEQMLENVERHIIDIDILLPEEKEQLLYEFNNTGSLYPDHLTIDELFEQQVEQLPDRIALIGGNVFMTYRELNRRANRLAWLLRIRGALPGGMVGIMLERSPRIFEVMLAILKVRNSYLPIDTMNPQKRTVSILDDARVPLLITDTPSVGNHSFTILQGLRKGQMIPLVTGERPQITNLDGLPFAHRWAVDYEKYNKYIGQGSVKNSISLQATRGCPYKCTYCHKIWPKGHVYRSAENIFQEVQLYYNMGVRRFVFVDDIFNLNIPNSQRFFQLIIERGLKAQMFFPNGVRGDILTREYIDLMVKAGVTGLALALETASPRLQKLIGKNLDLERLRENLQYLCEKYPQVMLELFIMISFPTETKEEALLTLDFVKSLKWIHFPYISILRIFPNTDMEKFAIENGISQEAIARSQNLAFHELPETLVFDKNFTKKYQSDFFNRYFLSKERLLKVLPRQMRVFTEDEITQKYNSYLPAEIRSLDDLLQFVGINRDELDADCLEEDWVRVPGLNGKIKAAFPQDNPDPDALRVLLLDVSQNFSDGSHMIYNVVEPPLGLMHLLAYLKHTFGPRVNGKIAKSRIDFDNYLELHTIIKEFRPDLIGIRTLTFYRDNFHKTAAMLRHWGFDGPVIAGGPYATSAWDTILQDRNIDVVVRGEGEITFCDLVRHIIDNGRKLPPAPVLKNIPGIAYVGDHPGPGIAVHTPSRQILLLDQLDDVLTNQPTINPGNRQHSADDFVYIIYTSGSTGVPRGILTTHANVTRVVKNTNYLEFTPSDRVLQLSNYAFDGSVFDIYGALLNGAGLVSVNRKELMEVQQLAMLIEKQGIDVFFVTTALFNTLTDLGLQHLRWVKKILFGGERVSLDHTKRAVDYLGNGHIIHMYGPTETTVFATYHPVNKSDERLERLGTVPIGGPLANTEIYILDERQNPVPIGVEGEIYIGGKGLAVGYLNHPDLTAQHFIESNDIHKTINKERLYRTGDLARWLWDGTIEFLDRKDKQVKLRGFRIELGEIETHLLNHPAVREVVVIAREDEQKDKYLCAYLVAAEQIEITSIKEYLEGLLPGFMIPSYFVQLPQLPLNANGKINTALLPDPLSQRSQKEKPRFNPLESRLAEIWTKVLGLKASEIARDADFFELGGHSLKATVALSMIHKELKVKVPVQEMFRTPTIREIAKYISKVSLISYEVIPKAEKKEYYRSSSVQKRMYFVQQLQTESSSYNIPTVVILEGEIDYKKLNGAFQSLLIRHESFRTSFAAIDGEVVQVIHENPEFTVEYYEDKEENARRIIENFLRPFDLLRAPLLRVGLIKIMEDRHILMVDMHHIISDGVSYGILIKEFSKFYSGDNLTPLRINYKDFSEWQNKRLALGEMNRQKEYWLSKFKKGDIPTLNMPLDYPRPSVRDIDAGDHINFSLDTILCEKIYRVMKKTGTTLSMMLVAVYNVLLYHYTKQGDIIIGVVITGRTHADLENVIGMFVNTVPIRNYQKRDKRFSKFLEEVKESMLSASENQDYPFDELVINLGLQGVTNKNPLFDVAFNLNNIESTKVKPTDLVMKPYNNTSEFAKFDIAIYVNEINQTINFIFRYSTQLFKRSTIEKLKIYFSEIIDQVVNNVDIKLKDITLSHGFAETKSSIYKENKQAFNL